MGVLQGGNFWPNAHTGWVSRVRVICWTLLPTGGICLTFGRVLTYFIIGFKVWSNNDFKDEEKLENKKIKTVKTQGRLTPHNGWEINPHIRHNEAHFTLHATTWRSKRNKLAKTTNRSTPHFKKCGRLLVPNLPPLSIDAPVQTLGL